ncbi:MAG: hypothetical protein KAR38_09245 [Calditrichia bacterium]|nr:hypothetical protein [Calditrichia bacterium]
MIVIGTAGKVLASTGLQGPDVNELKSCLGKIKSHTKNVSLEHHSIKVNEDMLLGLEFDEKFYPFTMNALKTICSLLKVPAAYLNKLISNELTLKNFNENPLKMGTDLQAVIWTDDEDEENQFIAGFLSAQYLPVSDLLDSVETTGFTQRNNMELHHWVYTPEEAVLNYLQKELFEINENNVNYTYRLGVSIHHAEAADKNLVLTPFYHVRLRLPNGEWMEWDFETKGKLGNASRKLSTFSGEAGKILATFEIGKLSSDFLNMKVLIESSNTLDDVKYKLLKNIYASTKSIFNHYAIPDTGQYVDAEIIPEFKNFKSDNKEKMKGLEPYQVANLPVAISLPVLFNRIYYSGLLLDNPHFMIKSRTGIYKIMYTAAEETNIVL